MAFFNFGKKKEETKAPACACSCGCSTAEATEVVNTCCGETSDGICCIKVLGAGCKNCHDLYEAAKAAVKNMGLHIEVAYVTDMEKIMEYGVMSMPALVVNETVVSMGKVLKTDDVEKLLRKLDVKDSEVSPAIGKKKLYVLTGFLGAGKTSLLLHLLDNLEGRKVGVIQNEFGKLSIDGALVNRNGIQMTEISRGSIFCSCLKGAFAQALAEMGKMNLEYVFVESSGLADPSNIEEILGEVTAIAGEVYDFKGVICLIDGVNFLEQLSDVETVDRQLAHCHMAVINKMDLIDDAQLAKVTDAIRQVNPICHVITSRFGLIDLDFLDMDLSALQWAPCEDSHNTVDNKPKTISLESEAALSREVLTAFLQAVLPDCYRIKGFFRLEEGWQQVDVVEKLIDFKPCQERELSQLVFLSKIGPKVIRTIDSAWKEIVKEPMKLKN